MIKFTVYIFYYIFLMIGGRLFFTLFFYKSYHPPSFGYTSSSKRQIAFQIDVGCLIILLFIFFILVNGLVSFFVKGISFMSVIEYLDKVPNSSLTTLIWLVLLLIIYCFYSAICELLTGATIGKKFMSIQSVTLDFKKPKTPQIIMRNGMKLMSLILSPVLFFIVYKDKKRRWLHDKASYTLMIDTQKIQVDF